MKTLARLLTLSAISIGILAPGAASASASSSCFAAPHNNICVTNGTMSNASTPNVATTTTTSGTSTHSFVVTVQIVDWAGGVPTTVNVTPTCDVDPPFLSGFGCIWGQTSSTVLSTTPKSWGKTITQHQAGNNHSVCFYLNSTDPYGVWVFLDDVSGSYGEIQWDSHQNAGVDYLKSQLC